MSFHCVDCSIGWKDRQEDAATIFAKAKAEEEKAREEREFNLRNNNFAFGMSSVVFILLSFIYLNVYLCI